MSNEEEKTVSEEMYNYYKLLRIINRSGELDDCKRDIYYRNFSFNVHYDNAGYEIDLSTECVPINGNFVAIGKVLVKSWPHGLKEYKSPFCSMIAIKDSDRKMFFKLWEAAEHKKIKQDKKTTKRVASFH